VATFLAHIKVHEGKEKRFEELAKDLFSATHENEEDVVRYEYWRGSESQTYYTSASFKDYLGFLKHQASSHHEEVASELREITVEIKIEWIDPILGASELVETNHQTPPSELGELATSYSERMPANAQPWWLELRN
jgi:quinol monooxygenase YgiN